MCAAATSFPRVGSLMPFRLAHFTLTAIETSIVCGEQILSLQIQILYLPVIVVAPLSFILNLTVMTPTVFPWRSKSLAVNTLPADPWNSAVGCAAVNLNG